MRDAMNRVSTVIRHSSFVIERNHATFAGVLLWYSRFMLRSVSRYESKLLTRSWFFRIFTILAVLILGILNLVFLALQDTGDSTWVIIAIPSNIPYFNLLFLNTGQAVIAVFLASDFVKRDKKLDTSEVFYVRPLSNATYISGKIWGNLRVFLILNLIIMGVAIFFTLMAPGVKVDWVSYIIYFFLISIPTLVYIIGLSIFLMLALRNQALTFIILLGYIGLTLFYLENKYYYVFDYMTYYLPLVKSSIVGFTNLGAILTHRSIYFFAGLAFFFFTISLFGRLPNRSRSRYLWILPGLCMLAASGFSAYRHVSSILDEGRIRAGYIEINNKYVHAPKMAIERYDISITQHPATISGEASMTGVALQTSSVFAFCLNPGLQVFEVSGLKFEVSGFERDRQIILINFGRDVMQGDTVSLVVRYGGRIDGRFCYLDIPEEVLQASHTQAMFNVDKQYSFQTADYLLFTPETYWYPRPGTAYSDTNAEWQQSYFSRFSLTVTPLPGLTALSPLAFEEGKDGAASIPVQAISLAVGKYRQKSMDVDSIRFSIWHIEGHDYFTAAFDSIADTIPALVRNVKEEMERRYKLDYPFRTFSIVEAPAQFFSYPRAWSQAQETVQPGMAFFPEKGWLFDQMNVHKRVKDQMRWAKRRGQEITDDEAQIRAFNDAIQIFINPEGGRDYSNVGRGEYNVTMLANPYFQFPQLYNFRYNIFSTEWSVSNRIVELYLQDREDNAGMEREINGISNNEKASLLMGKYSFKELLADIEHRDLLNNIISLRANRLFAEAEIATGVNTFRDTVYAVLSRHTFRNLQFETLLDRLGAVAHTDVRRNIEEWTHPTPLPVYNIGTPEVTKSVNRGQELFVLKIPLSNHSDYDGVVHLNIQVGARGGAFDPRANRKIALSARESKELVSAWEDEPREVTVNTMISGNLPATVTQPVRNIRQERSSIPAKEGDFVVPASSFNLWGEVIVDNEDSLLFVLSKPAVVGLLPRWLDKVETSSFKYSGIRWRGPVQWTATTNAGYYGKYIRSAYVIRGGNGSQTATWKVPVPAAGRYDVYYYIYKTGEIKNNRLPNAEYRFRVAYDNEVEDAAITLSRAEEGWELLGTYYFGGDTVRITLTNESRLRLVTADAVRIVRK